MELGVEFVPHFPGGVISWVAGNGAKDIVCDAEAKEAGHGA